MDAAVQEHQRGSAHVDLAVDQRLAIAQRVQQAGERFEVGLGGIIETNWQVDERESLAGDDQRLVAHRIVHGGRRQVDHRLEALRLQFRQGLGGWLAGGHQACEMSTRWGKPGSTGWLHAPGAPGPARAEAAATQQRCRAGPCGDQ
jgi:hypothetical protein